jgi:hypothetical protein
MPGPKDPAYGVSSRRPKDPAYGVSSRRVQKDPAYESPFGAACWARTSVAIGAMTIET